MFWMMPNFSEQFQATSSDANLLVLFIPSADRDGSPLGKKEQRRWVRKAFQLLGQRFTGATAFPRGWGIWRDDAMGGRLVGDKPVLVQCFTNETALRENALALREFLVELGTKTNQGAVACVLDKIMYQIKFPPKGA
jgi:hypothetical protein